MSTRETFGAFVTLVPGIAWEEEVVEGLGRRELSWREDAVTCALGTWLLAGLHVDGWAHRNLRTLDTIFTPWHAIFYSGFVALAVWILRLVYKEMAEGKVGLNAVPVGYGIGVLGIVIFFIGGIGDQIWHLSLGIERDLNAFLSPTHLLLAIGMFLMITSPLRSGWSRAGGRSIGLRDFAPTLWSIGLGTVLIMFVFNYLSIFTTDNPTIHNSDFAARYGLTANSRALLVLTEKLRAEGIGMLVLTNFLLFGMTLLALRRWRLPFGSCTFVFTATAAAVSAVYEYQHGWTVLAAAIGGVAADVLILRLDPHPGNVRGYRLFAALGPLVLWSAYFCVVKVAYTMGWPLELICGSTVLASLTALGLAVLMKEPAIPQELAVPFR